MSLLHYSDRLLSAIRVLLTMLLAANVLVSCGRPGQTSAAGLGATPGQTVNASDSSTSGSAIGSDSGITIVHGDRSFPNIETTVDGIPTDSGSLSAQNAFTRVTAQRPGSSLAHPQLEYCSLTDQNDVQTRNDGVAPQGLIDRAVWIAMYADVPASDLPPSVGDAHLMSGSASPMADASTTDDTTMFVLIVIDGQNGQPLETVTMPQSGVPG